MKQKRSRAAKRISAKPSVRKVGTMLGSGALCVLTVGTISVCGLLGQKTQTEVKADRETKAANVNTTDTARDEGAYTALDTVTWRKASINEYEFAEVSAPEATKVTESAPVKEATTSAAEKKSEKVQAETEDKNADKIKQIAKTFLYTKDTVSLRKDPDKGAEVIEVLDPDTRVVVDGCTDDGVWYSVRHGEIKGYAAAEGFTGKNPENNTKEEKSEEKKDEEKKSEEKKDEKSED